MPLGYRRVVEVAMPHHRLMEKGGELMIGVPVAQRDLRADAVQAPARGHSGITRPQYENILHRVPGL